MEVDPSWGNSSTIQTHLINSDKEVFGFGYIFDSSDQSKETRMNGIVLSS